MQMDKFLDPEILMLGIYSREIFTSLHKSISIIVTAAFKIRLWVLLQWLNFKSGLAVKSESLLLHHTLGD